MELHEEKQNGTEGEVITDSQQYTGRNRVGRRERLLQIVNNTWGETEWDGGRGYYRQSTIHGEKQSGTEGEVITDSQRS